MRKIVVFKDVILLLLFLLRQLHFFEAIVIFNFSHVGSRSLLDAVGECTQFRRKFPILGILLFIFVFRRR